MYTVIPAGSMTAALSGIQSGKDSRSHIANMASEADEVVRPHCPVPKG